MGNTLEAIGLLEDRLQTLFFNYEFLKKENEILLRSATSLQHKILEQQRVIADQKTAYDALKIAKDIVGGNTNTRETKLKINTLIREIDKCIIQLQE
jgi:hypothetical protein